MNKFSSSMAYIIFHYDDIHICVYYDTKTLFM